MNVYVDLDILPNGNLKIMLTDDGREELKDLKSRQNPLGTDDILHRLLEYHINNGWEFIPPEEVGAMTSSPILSNDVSRDDDGELTAIGNVWWHPNYMVINEIDELEEKGFVIFAASSENKEPT